MKVKSYANEFKSISDFMQYIENTPLNGVFRWTNLASTDKYYSGFNLTHTFEEAKKLLNDGWESKAQEIEGKLQLRQHEIKPKMVNRMQYDVVGFQASVPRYLQGIPTSMFNNKPTIQKQKVITLVKNIGYNCFVKSDTILEHSIRALQIVKKVEALGYRVNLDVMWITTLAGRVPSDPEEVACRIRIKSANERLNVSKMAFPLVHPDMLRRLLFRYLEVIPQIKHPKWTIGYGRSIMEREVAEKYIKENEYYLHCYIDDIETEIQRMQLK